MHLLRAIYTFAPLGLQLVTTQFVYRATLSSYSLLHHYYIILIQFITSSLNHFSIQFITSSLLHFSVQFISNTRDISTCPSYDEIFSGFNLNTLSVGFIRQCIFNQGINFIRQYDVYRCVCNRLCCRVGARIMLQLVLYFPFPH